MKKVSTAARGELGKFAGQRLTIGLDLGDRSSWYCVLDEQGELLVEQLSGATTGAEKLGAERAATAHQQGRRPLSKNADGAKRAPHSGAVWSRQRSAAANQGRPYIPTRCLGGQRMWNNTLPFRQCGRSTTTSCLMPEGALMSWGIS